MSVNLKIELTSQLPQLGDDVRKQLQVAMDGLAGDIAQIARKAIQDGPKTGIVYGAERAVAFTSGKGTDKEADVAFTAYAGRKLGDDKVHQASAPGEAPANEHGKLADSIKAVRVGELTWEVVVPATADGGEAYGLDLEFGTVKMAARPFLTPAVETVRPAFEGTVAAAVARGTGE